MPIQMLPGSRPSACCMESTLRIWFAAWALWVAAGTLWIMDATINISMEPFRAFVGDMLPSEQRTTGFSMQSFFIGTGAVVASALPYILTNFFHISNTARQHMIPDSVKFSFYIGGIVFIAAVLWTVFSTKEYSPEQLKEFSEDKNKKDIKATAVNTAGKENSSAAFIRNGFLWLLSGSIVTFYLYLNNLDLGLYVLFTGAAVFGLLQIITGLIKKNGNSNTLVDIINDLYNMPKTMRELAVVQFFSWFALFAMWIYTTPAVAHHIFGATDTTSAVYNKGADWVGVLMSVYNGFAAIMAFVIMLFLPIGNFNSFSVTYEERSAG